MDTEYYTIHQYISREVGKQFEVEILDSDTLKYLYPDIYKTKYKAVAKKLAYKWNRDTKLDLRKEK